LKRKWEILSSEYVVESPWYRLRRDACRLPDGTVIDPYYVREHPGFAVVFACTIDRDVVFTRQYKHGFGDFVLELPAGAIEAGEDALACAKRELEEETGYVARSLRHVVDFIADPTNSTGKLFLFFAEDAAPVGRRAPDPSEDIDIVLVPLGRVIDEVRAGRICGQSQVAAIYAMLDRLGLVHVASREGRDEGNLWL
jgi:8-oxo-dGTP pyrophosphatase MutT (NUDIX family)